MCGCCCCCCCSGRALSGLSATTTTRTMRTRTRSMMREGKKRFWRKKKNTKVILTALTVVGDDDFYDSQEQQIQVKSSFDTNIARLKPPSIGSSSLSSSSFNSSFTTTKITRTKKNEIIQLSISSSGKKTKEPMSYSYDESNVFDGTTILFSLIGFDIFFLVGLTVWVNGLKRRYENAIWKIKRLESEKRDLAVAFNLEKADLVDPLNTNAKNTNNSRRRIAPLQTPPTVPPSLGGGGGQPGPASANDVLLQGLKAERDALKQALKSVQGEMQRYAKENATLENELERALFEVEKLTPID